MANEEDLRQASEYPQPQMTFAEFEVFVAELLHNADRDLAGFRVTEHDVVAGVDGSYDFDATVRYRALGLDFLVLVEAKFHTNPIKRDQVQILHSKQTSVGAHKSLLVTTASFQSGAIEYARVHRIALASVTEGRFTIVTRSRVGQQLLTREQANTLLGVPAFVAVQVEAGEVGGVIRHRVIDPTDSRAIQHVLLGVPTNVRHH